MSVHQKILKKYNNTQGEQNNNQNQDLNQGQFQNQDNQQQQQQQQNQAFQNPPQDNFNNNNNNLQQNNTQNFQNNTGLQQNNQGFQQNGMRNQMQQQQINSNQQEQERKAEILEFSSYFNAQKLHVRPTTDFFPKTISLQKQSKMSFATTIQPLGDFQEEVPLASFGQDPILRCDYCRAYLNPFCKFIENGYRWKCNLCGKSEPVPTRYYKPLDSNGYREDINERAELYSGTFDIKAGQDYCARAPMPPSYFFLLDVSKNSIESGALEIMLNQIKEAILNNQLDGGDRTQIGILTFDSHLHVYSMKAGMQQPQMIVLTDPKDPEIPIPDDLLINIADQKDLVISLLESLPKMFQSNVQNEQQTSFIFALEAAIKIFKPVGGHLFIFQSSNTLIQEKIFQPKSQQQQGNQKNNNQNGLQDKNQFLSASSPHFKNLSTELHMAFITTSIFVFSNNFKNIINLTDLARYLNGQIYTYHDSPHRLQQLYYDFKYAVTKEIAWESVFRVRVSPGWKTTQIYGNYSVKTSDLLSYLTDPKKTLTYEYELEDTIARQDTFCLQTALLYTNGNGERRIRVHNYQIPLTSDIKDIYEQADATAISMALGKQCLHNMFSNPNIPLLKQQILQKSKELISTVMSFYKNNIPDSLMQLPLNILGLLKHRLFNNFQDATIECDLINTLRVNLLSMPIDEMISYFVPYIFDITDLAFNEDQTLGLFDEEGTFNFPPSSSLNSQILNNGGIFLMDAGFTIYIYINEYNADEQLLEDIFGTKNVNQVEQILTEENLYANSQNKINEKIYNLLNELRKSKTSLYCPLQIIRSGVEVVLENDFYYKLIEEKFEANKSGYNMDYNTFTSMLI